MESGLEEVDGVRVAVEGCGHGTLDAIYASVTASSKARGWPGVDLLIIGGDFQAARNAADLSVMSVPAKYRALGDFPAYYSGEKKAPYLTIFIAGNHEASSHLWELYHGGWVAPNIFYMGAANVLRFGPLRIAGMSGIWKGFDYRKPHFERLPFSQDDIKSFYHVREIDVRKLLLLRQPVDIGLSHDWPRAIEKHGNSNALFRMKPDFKRESEDGSLGNPAAAYVMDRLRPRFWFSAHLHCKFAAVKTFDSPPEEPAAKPTQTAEPSAPIPPSSTADQPAANPDEIDLDSDGEDGDPPSKDPSTAVDASSSTPAGGIPDELRAQLPSSFAKPPSPAPRSKSTPGQPVPATITNTTTRFLALDKCLPGRKFLQLCSIGSGDATEPKDQSSSDSTGQRYQLEYDPEWLAITRVFSPYLVVGDRDAQTPTDLGEEAYVPMIDKERQWVEENIVQKGQLGVPYNFTTTAPPHHDGCPETVDYQPEEYTNPQTVQFCELAGIANIWDASEEERAERKAQGPPASEPRHQNGGNGHRGRGRGRGGPPGFGGRGRGRGQGRGRGHGGWNR